jgi:serine phosphatase RsbU (regulator of sigma subunit)
MSVLNINKIAGRMLRITLMICLFIGYISAQTSTKKDSLLAVLYSSSSADTSKAKVCNTFARTFVPNHPDSIIYYGKKGAALVKSNKVWKSHLINTIGVGFFYKSEHDSALKYYLIALKLREETGINTLIGSSYNNIAVIYQIKGETEKAMEFYMRNLKFREKIKDDDGIANVCQNIGNLFNEQQDVKSALSYYDRTFQIRKKEKDTLSIAQVYLNIANCYDILDMQDSVYYYLTYSVPVLLKHNMLDGLAQAYNGLGIYYSKMGNPQLAGNYFTKSKDCYEKMDDMASVSFELVNIGMSKIDMKDYKNALRDCEQALPTILEVRYYEKLKYCYQCLYKAHKALDHQKEALVYHEKYSNLKDSLHNMERTKELTTIELTHKHNAEKEIEELKHKKDIEIREKEKENQRTFIYFIIFGLCVSIFLIAFVINRLNITKKQKLIIESQKKDVEEQKEIIMEKQKEILDSIHYAKRIQNTLLAHQDFLNENIPQNFVYFNPKDIVSGDFYWATKHGNNFYLAVCDSTGHGVPGAFMSLLNIGFLTEAINEKNIVETNLIFEYVRERLISGVSKEGQKDGFDGIIVRFNQLTNEITYTAAHNAPILISNNELIELSKDKMPVGIGEKKEQFTCHKIQVKQGDMLYFYTDGYADQFGGPKGKKFKYKSLNELLFSISNNSLEKQKQELESNFKNWKGNIEQVDDVCVIGIQI